MFEEINFLPGKIAYNDFDIDERLPFNEQEFAYTEDLFQVYYNEKLILDIGWYPEFCPTGKFRIVIVADENWEEPLYQKECVEVSQLEKLVKEGHSIIIKLLSNTSDNTMPYIMQVEEIFRITGRGIVFVGTNTGGVKVGDVIVDLDDKVELRVIGISHLYCSDAKRMRYLNSHPPILIDWSDGEFEALKGRVFLKKIISVG